MTLVVQWTDEARTVYLQLRQDAEQQAESRHSKNKPKSSKGEGLFKQVNKTLLLLAENPRHPGLQTHVFTSIPHPWKSGDKVFEAYVQNNTPGAFRVFWCYGPETGQITIIAITKHP